MDTFATAVVTSFRENLSGTPTGRISLQLPAASDVTRTPGALRRAGPFAARSGPSAATAAKTYVTLGSPGGGAPGYAATAVSVAQASPYAPVDLSITSTSLPLLAEILDGRESGIAALTVSVRPGRGTPVTQTFTGLSVSSFAEHRAGGVLYGTATLTVPPR